jgi:hypothetical protein
MNEKFRISSATSTAAANSSEQIKNPAQALRCDTLHDTLRVPPRQTNATLERAAGGAVPWGGVSMY